MSVAVVGVVEGRRNWMVEDAGYRLVSLLGFNSLPRQKEKCPRRVATAGCPANAQICVDLHANSLEMREG